MLIIRWTQFLYRISRKYVYNSILVSNIEINEFQYGKLIFSFVIYLISSMSSEYHSSDYSHWDEEGLREGEFKRWYGNGNIREQKFYRNGKLEGSYKSWYENGQISSHGFYKNGKWDGERRVWNYSGNLMMQAFYRNDDAEGMVKCWHSNGIPEICSFWKNGKKEGIRKYWSEDGCLLEREFYRNSIRINFLNQNEQQGFSQIKRMFRKNMIRLLDTILISDLAKLCL